MNYNQTESYTQWDISACFKIINIHLFRSKTEKKKKIKKKKNLKKFKVVCGIILDIGVKPSIMFSPLAVCGFFSKSCTINNFVVPYCLCYLLDQWSEGPIKYPPSKWF